jgi:hypothetical protein
MPGWKVAAKRVAFKENNMIIRRIRPRAIEFLAVLGCAAVLAGGCKNPEGAIVGKWNGPSGAALTFKADKTFSQSGGPMAAAGKWKLADKKLNLAIDTIGGKSIDESLKQATKMGLSADQIAKAKEQMSKGIDFTVSEDGKSMALAAPGAKGGQSVTFTKEETK